MAVDFWLQRLESNHHITAYEAVETPFLNSAVTASSILHRGHHPCKEAMSDTRYQFLRAGLTGNPWCSTQESHLQELALRSGLPAAFAGFLRQV